MARRFSGKPRKEGIAPTLSPKILQKIREMATKEKCSISSVAEKLLTIGLTCPHCEKANRVTGRWATLKFLHKKEWQTAIVSIIVSIVAAAIISGYYYNKSEKYQKEVYLNGLIKDSPVLSYTWLSNYKYYAFYPIDMTINDRILNLKSKFEIRNISGVDLEDVSLFFYFSLDPIASNPYVSNKGIHLINETFRTYKNNTAISFDVFDALKKRGIDLKILFPGGNVAYNAMVEFTKGKSSNYGPPFELDHNVDGNPPYIPVNIKGIYINGFIKLLCKGIRYTYVITGTIGHGFSDPNDIKQTKGMYVQDCFFKQGLSKIVFPSNTIDLIIPQYSYNGDDYIKDWIKPYGYFTLQAADKAGNYMQYCSWTKEFDGLYYYNKYASLHNMKYPPY